MATIPRNLRNATEKERKGDRKKTRERNAESSTSASGDSSIAL